MKHDNTITMNMNELIGEVRKWGEEKGITGPNGRGALLGQLSKTQEELRDALPPEMVEKWSQEDGSADYDSTLWSYGAEYIKQLKRQLAGTREEAENWRNNITPATEERLLFSWENNGVFVKDKP